MTNPVPESPGRYTKKPVTIEAMQWTGKNIQDLWEWCGADNVYGPIPAEGNHPAAGARLYVAANKAWLDLEIGEWIIKDKLGFYPCKDSVFVETYGPDDGSGILVIPPGLMDNLREAMYYPTKVQSKTTTISTDTSPDPRKGTLTILVDHSVEITAERITAPLRTEPHILVQDGKPVG